MSDAPLSPGPLPPGAVCWRQMDLDGEDGGCDFLSAEEQARAARFHFPEDARRWAVGRHLLRRTLGEVLSADPRALRFETGPLGKPRLAGSPLRFSVSHSDRRLLLALAWEREVGIDIERLRTDFVPEDLAAGVCSPDERDALGRVPPAARHDAFLALWTAKEAYGKALGVGLGFPLAALTLTLGTDGRYDCAGAGEPEIAVCRLDAGPGFAASAAAFGSFTPIELL